MSKVEKKNACSKRRTFDQKTINTDVEWIVSSVSVNFVTLTVHADAEYFFLFRYVADESRRTSLSDKYTSAGQTIRGTVAIIINEGKVRQRNVEHFNYLNEKFETRKKWFQ